ncbi:MAG TPA: mechanosensitive ion channel family protein [Dehalococcoidia bacterium]|nr:mechanosensitive ion channel family protein [Dehalococcoidia bacterium]
MPQLPPTVPSPETLLALFLQSGARVLLIIAVACIAYLVVRHWFPPLLRLALVKPVPGADQSEQMRRFETLKTVFLHIWLVVVIVLAAFMTLSVFGIDITPAVAGLGVVGVALGLGAQNIVRDCLGGLFILLENQYAVGDTVRFGTISGLVEDFSLRRTAVRDQDGSLHFIPNSEIKVATNLTRDWSRVNVDLALEFAVDLGAAIAVVDRVGRELAEDPEWGPQVISPPKFTRVDKLTDLGIVLKVVGETRAGRQWAVAGELLRRLHAEFVANGIRLAGSKPPDPAPASPPAGWPPPR